jgi:acetyl-CoA carboxylase biotin carboxyl carrier protein
MKAKEIKELISFIAESGLAEVNIETDEIKLQIKRNESEVAVPITPSVPNPTTPKAVLREPTAPQVADAVQTNNAAAPAPNESVADLVEIKSPMIGTFYRTPSPDADVFVNIGDTVKQGDVVCIIEAMKLFNEIESEVSGKIVKVLVENASPVEYDQPLFLVDPS